MYLYTTHIDMCLSQMRFRHSPLSLFLSWRPISSLSLLHSPLLSVFFTFQKQCTENQPHSHIHIKAGRTGINMAHKHTAQGGPSFSFALPSCPSLPFFFFVSSARTTPHHHNTNQSHHDSNHTPSLTHLPPRPTHSHTPLQTHYRQDASYHQVKPRTRCAGYHMLLGPW